MASENGLDRLRGDLPVTHPDDVEASPRLHQVSLDPVLGSYLWVEVLTDRVSESGGPRRLPAALPTPASSDGGGRGGEAGLARNDVAIAVGEAEVVQQAGYVEELGVVLQSVALRQDRAPHIAPKTVVAQ